MSTFTPSKDISVDLSPLPHLWLIDIDGTIIAHNSHLSGQQELLSGVKKFWNSIPEDDVIILLTARDESFRSLTLDFFNNHNLRFNQIIFGLPIGERILINDLKESGLITAYALNVTRDSGLDNYKIIIDIKK